MPRTMPDSFWVLILFAISSSAICYSAVAQDSDSIERRLRSLAQQGVDGRVTRMEMIDGLTQPAVPSAVVGLYVEQLEMGNLALIDDISEVAELWSDDFAAPLKKFFLQSRNSDARDSVLRALKKHRKLTWGVKHELLEGLRENGDFTDEPSAKFIEILGMIGTSQELGYLARQLGRTEKIPTGIGLSQPLPPGLLKLRVCDCAHDAIVLTCGGNLDARVAVAYHELDLTSQFDPRKINWASARTPGILGPIDDEVIIDARKRDQQLYDEVLKVRDKLIRDLIVEMKLENLP